MACGPPTPSATRPTGCWRGRQPLVDGHLAAASRERVEIAELPVGGRASSAGLAVSVVVPAFNARHMLGDLLDGLCPQLGDDAELVVVDDGSTDGSFEFLVQYAAAQGLRGRVIRLPQNRGRSVARNVGVIYSRGSKIAFTDSDCVPAVGWLGAGVARLDGPGTGIVQ